MKDQIAVMEQAKKDGVKRFVPSQFGGDRQTLDLDFFKPKKAMFEAVEKAAFPDGKVKKTTSKFEKAILNASLT